MNTKFQIAIIHKEFSSTLFNAHHTVYTLYMYIVYVLVHTLIIIIINLCCYVIRLYSYGEYKAEDQEQMLVQLDKKVADVYTKAIGPNEANIPYVLSGI